MTTVLEDTYSVLGVLIERIGYAPSIRNLGKVLGLSSTATYARLNRLMDAGLIDWPVSSLGIRQSHTMRLIRKEGT